MRGREIGLGEVNLKFSVTSCALNVVCCVRLGKTFCDNTYTHKFIHSDLDGGVTILVVDTRRSKHIYL
jgi:hypothetical protein